MTPTEPAQPSCLDPGSPIDVAHRIVIGTCGACQKPIKIKPIDLSYDLKPVKFTCSCGGVTAISFTMGQVRALAEAKRARERIVRDKSGLEASDEEGAPTPSHADAAAVVDERQGGLGAPAECAIPSCHRRVPWLARLRGWRKHGSGFLCPEHRSALVSTPGSREDLNRQLSELAAAAPANEAEIIQALLVHPEYPDQDKRERLSAVRELEEVLSERALAALRLTLLDPIADVAYAAVEVLEARREVMSLTQLLHDERLAVHAACALGRIRDAAAVSPLVEVWNHRAADPLARVSAAQALAEIGGPGVRPTMLKLLAHKEPHVRRIGLRALQKDGSEEAIAGIRTLVRKDSALRREAIEALGDMGASSAVHDLIEQLDSGEDWVSGDAAESLGKIGDARAVDPLLAHFHKLEPDDPDKGRFVDAIRRLSGSS